MITVREMSEMTNEKLAKTLALFDQQKETGKRYPFSYSTFKHLPYLDEYQRRLIDGRATGHYSEYLN